MNSNLVFLAGFCACLGFVSCSTFQNLFQDIYGQKNERDLRHHLFKDYDKLVRPIKNPSEKITVSAGITPCHLRELDEKRQVIVLETFTLMNWTDDYLKWEPSHFGNLTVLRVPSTEVWRPDLAIYGSPDQALMSPIPQTNVLIYNDGKVLWVPMFTITSRCPLLKANKKIVTCNIQLGSWTFSGNEMDIQLNVDKVDLSNFVDNNEHWKLIDVVSGRVDKYYPCCVEPYPLLHFNVTLKRRGGYSANGVLPEEDFEINLQEAILSDFPEMDKLRRRR